MKWSGISPTGRLSGVSGVGRPVAGSSRTSLCVMISVLLDTLIDTLLCDMILTAPHYSEPGRVLRWGTFVG
jgi:hypothetical protein